MSYGAPLGSVIGNALRCSIALTAFGVGAAPNVVREASIISATLPLTTPAAMLVPLSARYRSSVDWPSSCLSGSALNRDMLPFEMPYRLCPGATTSGLTNESYHVGPREL